MLLVVVILIALGVHSCQVSQRNSALKSYTNDVSSVITDSNNTGQQLFKILSSGVSSASGDERLQQHHPDPVAGEKAARYREGVQRP